MGANIVIQKLDYSIKMLYAGIEQNHNLTMTDRIVDCYVISYLTQGKGTYVLGGKMFTINNGEIYMIPQGIPYSQQGSKSDPYEYYYVAFYGAACEDLMRHAGLTTANPVLKVKAEDSAAVEEMFKAIYDYLGENTYLSIAKANSVFLDLLCVLFSDVEENCTENRVDSYFVFAAKQYIKDHYKEGIKIADLSRELKLDRTYLSRIFSKYEKITIKNYIINAQLEQAMTLLRDTQMSISKILYECGFTNLTTFYRVFQRVLKQSPSEYRKRNTEYMRK